MLDWKPGVFTSVWFLRHMRAPLGDHTWVRECLSNMVSFYFQVNSSESTLFPSYYAEPKNRGVALHTAVCCRDEGEKNTGWCARCWQQAIYIIIKLFQSQTHIVYSALALCSLDSSEFWDYVHMEKICSTLLYHSISNQWIKIFLRGCVYPYTHLR